MPTLGDGQTFERYKIIRWLGSGISGESYEAEDCKLLRKVTLKLIHPWSRLPDTALRQFFREMQGISTLNHPYLATVLDYGEFNERLYVTRRYVSSGSLLGNNGRLWFRPPVPLNDAFIYANQLAQALQYIHQHGYLHGTLNFNNILVLRGPNVENEANYAPFLLADIGLTNFVRRFGKPQIETLPISAAPEQLGKRVTPASDQFALAVLLYFWLTGRLPYQGTPDEIEQAKLTEAIPLASQFNPSMTREQDDILLRALSVYPEERHPSVLDFAKALMASLTSSQTLSARLPRQPETPQPIPYIPPATEEQPASLPEDAQPTQENDQQVPSAPLHQSVEEQPDAADQLSQKADTAEEEVQAIEEVPEPIIEAEEVPEPIIESEEVQATEESLPPIAAEEVDPLPDAAGKATTRPLPSLDMEESVVIEETAEVKEVEEVPGIEKESDESTTEAHSPEPQETRAAGEVTEDADQIADPQQTTTVASGPRLLVTSPYDNSAYEFPLERQETNVGRAGASDLLLEQDNLTSRHHALIKREGERILIFDKRSNNGVFINGQKIEVDHGYELADGDHIGIGCYELIFRSQASDPVSQLT